MKVEQDLSSVASSILQIETNKLLLLMLYKLVSFFLLIAISSKMEAQNFKLAFLAGATTSQVSGDNLGGFHKVGIMGGAAVNLRVRDSSFVEMEMIYVQKGSQQGEDLAKGKAFYQLKVDYIEVPLLYKLKRKKLMIEMGASLGYLVHSKVSDVLGEFPATSPEARPFKKTETSVCAGVSYKLGGRIWVSWRFSNSLLPIRNHYSGIQYKLNRGQYNTAMYLMLRYEL